MKFLIRPSVVGLLFAGAAMTSGATGAQAGGWIEDDYQGSSECDFDGDGVYSVYETVPDQTASTLAQWNEDGNGVTHVSVIQRLHNVEYFSADADPETVYYSGDVHFFGLWDVDNEVFPLDGKIRVRVTITDASGGILGTFSVIATSVDGSFEPLHVHGGDTCLAPSEIR